MRTEGFTELVCDRGGCQEPPVYASADKVDRLGWARISVVGERGDTREFDLCPGCYAKYREMQMEQCAQTMAFINGGEQ